MVVWTVSHCLSARFLRHLPLTLMAFVDLILNLVALMFWLNWRYAGFEKPKLSPPSQILVSNLRIDTPADSSRWTNLVGLLAILLLRGWIYHNIGGQSGWTPNLNFGPLAISFRSDFVERMFLFSLLSFTKIFLCFYFWLLILSALNDAMDADKSFHRWTCLHLGFLDDLPVALKWILPGITASVLWFALLIVFSRMGLVPPAGSLGTILLKALLMGIHAYFVVKFLLLGILGLHLLNLYVYVGSHDWVDYVSRTAKNLLRPLAPFPTRFGKLEFAPAIGLILILLADHFGHLMLEAAYRALS